MFPIWLKIAFTIVVSIIVVVYVRKYGPANFLWFSDIALLVAVPALWLESSLLASMMAVSITLLEIAWNIDFFGRLATGYGLFGLSNYMFDRRIPLWIRALSLFHIVLPPLLLWMVYRLGYDKNALIAQTVLAWTVLPITYLLAPPSENINWVRGLRNHPQKKIPAPLYLILLMLMLTFFIYVPTHLLLKKFFDRDTYSEQTKLILSFETSKGVGSYWAGRYEAARFVMQPTLSVQYSGTIFLAGRSHLSSIAGIDRR